MTASLQKRLLQGGGATTLAQVTNTVIQLLGVPLFLATWGTEQYGAWLIVSTIPSYFAMSDVGFGSAAANDMTMRAGRGDLEGVLRVFQSVVLFVAAITSVCLIAGVAFVWSVPVERILHVQVWDHTTTATTLTLLLLYVVANVQGSVLAGAYRALGLYARSTMLGVGFRLAEFAAVAVVLRAGAGPVAVAGVALITRGASVALYYMLLRAQIPWLKYGLRYVSKQTFKSLAGPAVAFQGFPLGYAISIQGTVSLIGIVMGPAAVVTFTTVRTLVNSAKQAIGIINSTVWPELSRAYGAGEMTLARTLHGYACGLAFWIGACAAAFLAVFGQGVLAFWTAGRITADPVFLGIMLLGVVGNALWSTSLVVPSAINQHQRLAGSFVGAAVVGLFLLYVLVPYIGLVGAAISLLVIDLVMSLLVVRQSLSLVGERAGDFVRHILAPVVLVRRLLRRHAKVARSLEQCAL